MSRKPATTTKKTVDQDKLKELFAQFADPEDPDVAYFDGIAKLFEMLGLDAASDIRTLVMLWKLGIPVTKPGQISMKDFVDGMTKLNIGDIQGLQAMIPSLDPGFLERQEFRGKFPYIMHRLHYMWISNCRFAFSFSFFCRFVQICVPVFKRRHTQNIRFVIYLHLG